MSKIKNAMHDQWERDDLNGASIPSHEYGPDSEQAKEAEIAALEFFKDKRVVGPRLDTTTLAQHFNLTLQELHHVNRENVTK